MRPRKHVAIYSPDAPHRASLLRYSLDTGMHVKTTIVETPNDAARFDALVYVFSGPKGPLVEQPIPLVAVDHRQSTSYVIECLRLALTKRRGPKPKAAA